MLILGVDIGVLHLAIAGVETAADYQGAVVVHVELINTMHLEHERVPAAHCLLHHTGMAADRVAHVVQQRQPLFDRAHCIVIERQPPGGLRDVEQVLLVMFRAKAVVMCPQTMHAHIGSSQKTYPVRKALAVLFASQFVPDLACRFPGKTDDVADAVCLAMTHVHAQAAVVAAAKARAAAAAQAASRGLDLEGFRYEGGAFFPRRGPPPGGR